MGYFNGIILCLCLNLMSALGHPEDIDCFEENFSTTPQHSDHHRTTPQHSDYHPGTSPQSYQTIIIKQFFRHTDWNGNETIRNLTIVKTDTVNLVEGEKMNFGVESQLEESSTNPRNLTLKYFSANFNGELTQAAIGHFQQKSNSSDTWTCSTAVKKAPEEVTLTFSTVTDKFAQTHDVETLELEIIQSDVSCFESKFAEMVEDNLEQEDCRDRNTTIVDIEHLVGTYSFEAVFKEIRETLVKGEKKFVELTSQSTDVLNPRYLVMLFDGVWTKAAINSIWQDYPTDSTCLSISDSQPTSWSPKFADTFHPEYKYDKLIVKFRDPKKPWGDEKDLECFGIQSQFNDCDLENDLEDGPSNASIYVSHYYQNGPLFEITTVEIETIQVNITKGMDKIVQFQYQNLSNSFDDENPRNLTLSLVGSELRVGIGQLFDHYVFGSVWTCLNSSLVLPLGSKEKKEIMFYKAEYRKDLKYIYHKEFLSFSWNKPNKGVRIDGTGTYLSIIALYTIIMILQ